MSTQQNQNQNEIKKKGIKVNPSRDADYAEKEKKLASDDGEKIDEEANEEVNPSKLDTDEVHLDRGGVEFSGGGNQSKKH